MSSKDAKKSQEEARLQQLKQEMRNSTDNMAVSYTHLRAHET